jgi:hypothetical protein
MGKSTSKSEPQSSKGAAVVTGVTVGKTREKKTENGTGRPMLAEWLRESVNDGPYCGVDHSGQITVLPSECIDWQVNSAKGTTSSLEYLEPLVKDIKSFRDNALSPVEPADLSTNSSQDQVAFCGSWQ